jgi:hypothetical protein
LVVALTDRHYFHHSSLAYGAPRHDPRAAPTEPNEAVDRASETTAERPSTTVCASTTSYM